MRRRTITACLKYLFDGSELLERWICWKERRGGRKIPSSIIHQVSELLRHLLLQDVRPSEGGSGPKKKRVILMEALFEHPGCNYNSWIVFELIRAYSGNAVEVIALTRNKRSLATQVMTGLGVTKIIHWTQQIRLSDRIHALQSAFQIFRRCKWDSSQGWRITIEGVDCGDLLHDDLLRKANIPTNSTKNLLLFTAIYFAALRLRGYKRIIQEQGVTDIVCTHDVYLDFGLFHRASPKDVTLWGWYGTSHFQIHQSALNLNTNLKPKYVTAALLNTIEQRFQGQIDQWFESLFKKRMEGSLVRSFDEAKLSWGQALKKNAETEVASQPKRVRIVIFAHVFVDAVNYAEWRLFPDYYSWFQETLSALAQNRNVSVSVRPHPSEQHYEVSVTVDSIVRNLCQEHPTFDCKIAPKNQPLMEALSTCDLVVTAAGTIAIEAPALGIPTLVAAAIRTENAGALIQPRTREEYLSFLLELRDRPQISAEQIKRAKFALYADVECTEVATGLNLNADPTNLVNRHDEWNRYRILLQDALETRKRTHSADPLISAFQDAHLKSVQSLPASERQQIQMLNLKRAELQ